MQTLSELTESFHVYGVCEACDRMEQLNLTRLVETLGGDYPVSELRARLRCSQCQSRTDNMRIVYVGPNARTAAFNYRR